VSSIIHMENPTMEEIRQTVKSYILKEFLFGENPDELTDSTPLITGGILDSIATLKLVAFMVVGSLEALRDRTMTLL